MVRTKHVTRKLSERDIAGYARLLKQLDSIERTAILATLDKRGVSITVPIPRNVSAVVMVWCQEHRRDEHPEHEGGVYAGIRHTYTSYDDFMGDVRAAIRELMWDQRKIRITSDKCASDSAQEYVQYLYRAKIEEVAAQQGVELSWKS